MNKHEQDDPRHFERFTEILKEIKYKDWKIGLHYQPPGRFYIQVRFMAPCTVKGVTEEQPCRKWQLSPYMTRTEVVRTAWKAIVAAEMHEAEENFKYKGRAIYSPHFDVEALVDLADMNKHDVRK